MRPAQGSRPSTADIDDYYQRMFGKNYKDISFYDTVIGNFHCQDGSEQPYYQIHIPEYFA